jgi:hypothetical protein
LARAETQRLLALARPLRTEDADHGEALAAAEALEDFADGIEGGGGG